MYIKPCRVVLIILSIFSFSVNCSTITGTFFRGNVGTHMLAFYHAQETESALECCRLCTREKACQSVNYNRDTGECEFVPQPSLALGLTDWTNEEEGWNTYATDDWFLVFRGTSGIGGDVLDTYVDRNDEYDVNCLRLDWADCFDHIQLLDDWEDFGVYKVKLSVFKDGEEKQYVIFDGVGADMMSWFDQGRILESSWPLLQADPLEHFSIEGDQSRRFFISFPHMGCENDMGYLAVLAEYDENCDYDIQEVYPTILFADSPSATHWNNITDAGRADFIAVSVKASGFPPV